MDQSRILSISPCRGLVLAVVQCHEFCHDSTARLKKELACLVEQESLLPVVLDLSNVQFLASMTLGVLVEANRNFDRANKRFFVVGLSQKLCDIMYSCAILNLFSVCDTIDAVMQEV